MSEDTHEEETCEEGNICYTPIQKLEVVKLRF